jgi:hypothetical protein
MRRHTAAVAIVIAQLVVTPDGAQTPPAGRGRGAPAVPALPVISAPTARQLAGTWTLVSIERPGNGGRLTSLPFPRGLLVIDSAGHIFEGVQHGRPQGSPALGERQQVLATFSGFWGRYTLQAGGQSMTITPRGAVHPNIESAEFSRLSPSTHRWSGGTFTDQIPRQVFWARVTEDDSSRLMPFTCTRPS